MPKKKTDEMKLLDRGDEASDLFLDGMPYRLDDVVNRMAGDLVSIQNNFIDIGMCALSIKHVHGHGKFMDVVEEKFEKPGICSSRTIRNAMKVAQFISDNPKLEKFSNLTALSKMKQLMLAGAKEEDIDEDEGTIFGLTMDEIKAKKVKELKKHVSSLTGEVEDLTAENEKGSEQLNKMREKYDRIKEKYKYIGEKEEAAEEILDETFNLIHAHLASVVDQIDKKKMSPRLQAKVRAWIGGVCVLVDEYNTGVCTKLSKHKDPKAWKPPWARTGKKK